MAKYSKRLMGREVGAAAVYAEPHDHKGKKVVDDGCGTTQPFNKRKNWQPMDGVSITCNDSVKTDGIKVRGTGAAIKGVTARGPMG